jgi:OOP family OmpA-OmpF porin
MKTLKVLAISGLLIGAAPAFAQWSGGFSAGVTSTSLNTSGLAVAGATASSISKDERDTGYKIQAGYQFAPNWAVEFGYVDLGKFNAVNNVTAPVVGSVRVDGKADGWNAVAVGTLPLSNGFSLLGKLGTIYSTASATASVSGAVVLPAGTQANWKKSEWNWAYGLGVQYDINKTMSLRGEWDRYDGLRVSGTSNKISVNLYSVGLNFKF